MLPPEASVVTAVSFRYTLGSFRQGHSSALSYYNRTDPVALSRTVEDQILMVRQSHDARCEA